MIIKDDVRVLVQHINFIIQESKLPYMVDLEEEIKQDEEDVHIVVKYTAITLEGKEHILCEARINLTKDRYEKEKDNIHREINHRFYIDILKCTQINTVRRHNADEYWRWN